MGKMLHLPNGSKRSKTVRQSCSSNLFRECRDVPCVLYIHTFLLNLIQRHKAQRLQCVAHGLERRAYREGAECFYSLVGFAHDR